MDDDKLKEMILELAWAIAECKEKECINSGLNWEEEFREKFGLNNLNKFL